MTSGQTEFFQRLYVPQFPLVLRKLVTAAATPVSVQAMEVVLPPEIEKLVEEKVASGEYPTPADVLQATILKPSGITSPRETNLPPSA